ncbi:hypothetical protein ACNIRM_17870 [Escherichia coli]|uniref:hypothetical protein n=1 Tax=Escherichia coli TaxID=562 RepID=UPI00176FF1AA|nr:hypothetical protein [Escherichia coli]EKT7330760.1 hypothetical protein [Escherichia coli]HAI1387265.1 hypothetical protein [Escherichia coli]HAO9477738.1 hypothetical protein [Escherichia coli]HAO9532623.1 hypothetical protein [Escherichia coli]HAO9553226.1 hypothetical protein [Escherichia coli]
MSDFLGHIINLEIISGFTTYLLIQTPTNGTMAYICGTLYGTNKKMKYTKQKKQKQINSFRKTYKISKKQQQQTYNYAYNNHGNKSKKQNTHINK